MQSTKIIFLCFNTLCKLNGASGEKKNNEICDPIVNDLKLEKGKYASHRDLWEHGGHLGTAFCALSEK